MSRSVQVPIADDLPEADRLDGTSHPRNTLSVLGQQQAEETLLKALASDRLHHAWLITGPQGVGKASFAWRAARFLLTRDVSDGNDMFGAPPPAESLDTDPDDIIVRRAVALSEPRLMLLRRPYDEKNKRFKQDIPVDTVRELHRFFALSVPDGGRRVVIVDAADDMNTSAANALLKQLEEPPAHTVFLLISHRPSRLLPTIRSRCRELRCAPLPADLLVAALAQQDIDVPEGTSDEALCTLAGGSVGRAAQLTLGEGLALYGRLIALMSGLPDFDRQKAIALAEWTTARDKPERFDLFCDLLDMFLSRLARTGAAGPPAIEAAHGEGKLMARLCRDVRQAQSWAAAQDRLGAKLRTGRAANLDPAALFLDTIFEIAATAKGRASA